MRGVGRIDGHLSRIRVIVLAGSLVYGAGEVEGCLVCGQLRFGSGPLLGRHRMDAVNMYGFRANS